MSQRRLNSCMILHTYKEETDEINAEEVVCELAKSHIDRARRIATATS